MILFLSSITIFIIKFIHSNTGKDLIVLSCISFTIKYIGYSKSISMLYPLEKLILIKVGFPHSSGFWVAKSESPNLKFNIKVKLHPIFNSKLLKSTSK